MKPVIEREAGGSAIPWRNSPGFSMVELILGIAVLAILIALTVPALMRQAEKGRESSCSARLRNLAVAMSLFRAERNQRMWNADPVADGGEGSSTPSQILYKYGFIKSGVEMRCPSATTSETGAWKTGGTGSADYVQNIATQYVSYAVNGPAFYQFSPWRTSTIVTNYRYYSGHESKTPQFMDGLAFQLNLTSWQLPMRFSRLALRHLGRCNVLYMDGHVESLGRAEVERIDPTGGTNPAWMKDFGVQ